MTEAVALDVLTALVLGPPGGPVRPRVCKVGLLVSLLHLDLAGLPVPREPPFVAVPVVLALPAPITFKTRAKLALTVADHALSAPPALTASKIKMNIA